jgi:DNA-binding response OmpR family regulator
VARLDAPLADTSGFATHDAVVALVRWPEDAGNIEQLRAAGTPRLLVVARDEPAPESTLCDEDWIRLPASDADMRARMHNLAARAGRHLVAPVVKGDGRIVFRGSWTALGPTEQAMARALASRFGDVVTTDTLAHAVDPHLTATGVRVQIMRLRNRVAPLGLELRTVRNHGYVLQAVQHA